MGDEHKSKSSKCHSGDFGIIWFIGWLFSIGFLKLAFWKAVLALILYRGCFKSVSAKAMSFDFGFD